MKRDGDADGSTGAESPDESRELEAFAEDLRSAFPQTPVDPASQQAHLVAMMEAADKSVSVDLLVRSLLAIGATRRDLAKVLATKP